MKPSAICSGRRLAIAAGMVALAVSGCGEQPAPKPKLATTPPAVPAPAPAPETRAVPAPEKPVVADAQAASDKALADSVKSALAAAPGLNAHRIDVTARNGAVTLFGTAETKAQREAAGKSAAAVTGVKSVENKLAVVAGS